MAMGGSPNYKIQVRKTQRNWNAFQVLPIELLTLVILAVLPKSKPRIPRSKVSYDLGIKCRQLGTSAQDP